MSHSWMWFEKAAGCFSRIPLIVGMIFLAVLAISFSLSDTSSDRAGRYIFGYKDGTIISSNFRLREDGQIVGYDHPNERGWAVVGSDVLIYSQSGSVSHRLSVYEKNPRVMIKNPGNEVFLKVPALFDFVYVFFLYFMMFFLVVRLCGLLSKPLRVVWGYGYWIAASTVVMAFLVLRESYTVGSLFGLSYSNLSVASILLMCCWVVLVMAFVSVISVSFRESVFVSIFLAVNFVVISYYSKGAFGVSDLSGVHWLLQAKGMSSGELYLSDVASVPALVDIAIKDGYYYLAYPVGTAIFAALFPLSAKVVAAVVMGLSIMVLARVAGSLWGDRCSAYLFWGLAPLAFLHIQVAGSLYSPAFVGAFAMLVLSLHYAILIDRDRGYIKVAAFLGLASCFRPEIILAYPMLALMYADYERRRAILHGYKFKAWGFKVFIFCAILAFSALFYFLQNYIKWGGAFDDGILFNPTLKGLAAALSPGYFFARINDFIFAMPKLDVVTFPFLIFPDTGGYPVPPHAPGGYLLWRYPVIIALALLPLLFIRRRFAGVVCSERELCYGMAAIMAFVMLLVYMNNFMTTPMYDLMYGPWIIFCGLLFLRKSVVLLVLFFIVSLVASSAIEMRYFLRFWFYMT